MPRSVQFSEEAYGLLAALKRPGESFSDTVKRLAASRKNPRALLKLGPRVGGYSHEEARRRMDAADRRRLRQTLGRGARRKGA